MHCSWIVVTYSSKERPVQPPSDIMDQLRSPVIENEVFLPSSLADEFGYRLRRIRLSNSSTDILQDVVMFGFRAISSVK
jgi:hypothetical protein